MEIVFLIIYLQRKRLDLLGWLLSAVSGALARLQARPLVKACC